MKRYTTIQAAKIGGCHRSTIVKMIKTGLLKGGLVDPESPVSRSNQLVIHNLRDEIREIVAKNAPRSGFKKRVAPAAPPIASDTNLQIIVQFAQLDADKRGVLIQLAEKFSAADLQVLLSL